MLWVPCHCLKTYTQNNPRSALPAVIVFSTETAEVPYVMMVSVMKIPCLPGTGLKLLISHKSSDSMWNGNEF